MLFGCAHALSGQFRGNEGWWWTYDFVLDENKLAPPTQTVCRWPVETRKFDIEALYPVHSLSAFWQIGRWQQETWARKSTTNWKSFWRFVHPVAGRMEWRRNWAVGMRTVKAESDKLFFLSTRSDWRVILKWTNSTGMREWVKRGRSAPRRWLVRFVRSEQKSR